MISRIPSVLISRKAMNHHISLRCAARQRARPFHSRLHATTNKKSGGAHTGSANNPGPIPQSILVYIKFIYRKYTARESNEQSARGIIAENEEEHIAVVASAR